MKKTIDTPPPNDHGMNLRNYTIGFVVSLLLTLLAYTLVTQYLSNDSIPLSQTVVIIALAVLAMAQFVVQLVLFLHLGTERKPRWKFFVFWFMIFIVLILVVGSLWIMHNLDYNMMSPAETRIYMKDHEGF
ncbi:cytochrome o ubiquinol oxidase subunit IV [bacterium]|nr:MAG: cytochrome o ubiquinol oxidase subunit IV [bacterium]